MNICGACGSTSVSSNHPDLRSGDVIYSIDGVEADPPIFDCLVYLRLNVSAGEEVDLGVLRDGVRTKMTARTHRQRFRKLGTP